MWTFKVTQKDNDEFGYPVTTSLKWDEEDASREKLYQRLVRYSMDNEIVRVEVFHNGKLLGVAKKEFHIWMIEGTRTTLFTFMRG